MERERDLRIKVFTPHPALEGSIGIASGPGKNPIWLFSINTKPETVINFYRISRNRKGWTLTNETGHGITFERKRSITTGSISVRLPQVTCPQLLSLQADTVFCCCEPVV